LAFFGAGLVSPAASIELIAAVFSFSACVSSWSSVSIMVFGIMLVAGEKLSGCCGMSTEKIIISDFYLFADGQFDFFFKHEVCPFHRGSS
jgi:hypothetical protein